MKKITKLMTQLWIVALVMTILPSSLFLSVDAQQQSRALATGASLSEQERQRTIELLGGTEAEHVLAVDGNLINHYLQDGSNAQTGVFSSVLIEPQTAGFGVQVQLVTPDKITKVTPATYQNAAITSGAKDILIKIGSVKEVTGEGALVGVYALLEKSGLKVDTKAIKVAEKEIQIIQNIKDKGKLNDAQVNVALATIKKEISLYILNNKTINLEQITTIVNNCLSTYNIVLDKEDFDKLVESMREFSETDTAKQDSTSHQLDMSVTTQGWEALLASLSKGMSKEEIFALEKPDFSAQGYHPIMQALLTKYYEYVTANQPQEVERLYSHTFAIEKMLPELDANNRSTLNAIRALCYYYLAGQYDSLLPNHVAESQAGNVLPTVKEQWLYNLNQVRSLEQDPVLAEVAVRIGIATGRTVEGGILYDIHLDGDGWLEYAYKDKLLEDSILKGALQFGTGKYRKSTTGNNADVVEIGDVFELKELYGVEVANGYVPKDIAMDYQLPAYIKSLIRGTMVDMNAYQELYNLYTEEEILAAHIWIMERASLLYDDTFTEWSMGVIRPAGTPIDYINGLGVPYPQDVRSLSGSLGAHGTITYGLNADGTVTLYNVPSRWHFSPEDAKNEDVIGKFTQEIIDNARTVVVEEADLETLQYVLSKLNLSHRDIEQNNTSDNPQSQPTFSIEPIVVGQNMFKGTLEPNVKYKLIIVDVGEIEGIADATGVFEFTVSNPEWIKAGAQIIVQIQKPGSEEWIDVLATQVMGSADGTEVNEVGTQSVGDTPQTENVNKFLKLLADNKDKNWKELLSAMDVTLSLEEIKSLPRPNFEKVHPIIPAIQTAVYQTIDKGESVIGHYSRTLVLEYMQLNLTPEDIQALNYLRAIMYQYHATFDGERQQKAESFGVTFFDAKTDWLKRLESGQDSRKDEQRWNEMIQIAIATGYSPECFWFEEANGAYAVRDVPVGAPTASTLGFYRVEEGYRIMSMDREVKEIPSVFDWESVYGISINGESAALEQNMNDLLDFSGVISGSSILRIRTKPNYTLSVTTRVYQSPATTTADGSGWCSYSAQMQDGVTHYEGDEIYYELFDESGALVTSGTYVVPANSEQPASPTLDPINVGDDKVTGTAAPNSEVVVAYRTDGRDYFVMGQIYYIRGMADASGRFELHLADATGWDAAPGNMYAGVKVAAYVEDYQINPATEMAERIISQPTTMIVE